MTNERYVIQSETPFAESLIWQLNRDFYQEIGIKAWSEGSVPHQMTSNSQVGLTYAELIFAFLKDLESKGRTQDKVYILELGAGHGRLAFHILKHLDRLIESVSINLPKYCYVLSDIVESNLSFFENHPQLQSYLQNGKLDVAYFDAIGSKELDLRYSKTKIKANSLNVPILAIANYFFDSIPNDLYYIKNGQVSSCALSIKSKVKPQGVNTIKMMKEMEMTYHNTPVRSLPYQASIVNEILEEYKSIVSDTYLFFPFKSFECIDNIKALSKEGLVLISMDKGLHEAHRLDNKKKPDLISHGSFSLWVNFHAIDLYCKKLGGESYFPLFSNFHLEIGCMMFLSDGKTYSHTKTAYQKTVDDFGPDDFNTIKKMVYSNVGQFTLMDFIAIFRLSAYDSTIFIKLFSQLRRLAKQITYEERHRLMQTIEKVWDMYFHINEPFDLAYESGGLLYDLGEYSGALNLFQKSIHLYGAKADVYYNLALCYYQLRQDKLFYSVVNEVKIKFPQSPLIEKLLGLDMV